MSLEHFLQSIVAEPAAAAEVWPILADWLDDHGDPRVEFVRLMYDEHCIARLSPEVRDERIRELLRGDMEPVAATLTNSIGMRFTLIPAGRFLMGSPADEEGRSVHEEQHEVEITRPFFLGIHTVTQEVYERVTGSNPSWFSANGDGKDAVAGLDTSRFPVENVSWDEADEFCWLLSESPVEKAQGHSYRLPTEAEWEYACRGGARSYTVFSFGNALDSSQANFTDIFPYGGAAKGVYLNRSSAVGSYRPNAFGLYDMHGNIWEWCADWHGLHDTSGTVVSDPAGASTGSYRVLRGGSWGSTGRDSRSAIRLCDVPYSRNCLSGFRLVCVRTA